MTELEKLKKKTGEADEELLQLLLDEASEDVLIYTRRSSLVAGMLPYVRQLALISYNRLGTEGESSRSEGGESYSFDNELKSIYEKLNQFRLARVGGYTFERRCKPSENEEEQSPEVLSQAENTE